MKANDVFDWLEILREDYRTLKANSVFGQDTIKVEGLRQ